jgi:outer membrane autotransporter protein
MIKRHPRFCFISFLLLSLSFCFSAVHADVTITTAETATVDLETRNPVASPRNATVGSGGSVDVTANPANDSAIWASVDGWNVTVSSGREIKGNTFGVLFNADADGNGNFRSGVLTNTGTISATLINGSTAGVYMGGDSSFINNSGSITGTHSGTSSFNAFGVYMYGAKNTLASSGTITGNTYGDYSYAYGVNMEGHENKLTNSGSISGITYGDSSYAYGVNMEGDENSLNNSGAISVTTTKDSSKAYGVYVEGNTVTLNNAGTISGTATKDSSEAYGVHMSGGVNTLNNNSGTITGNANGSSSEAPCGAILLGITNTLNNNSGTITGNATKDSPSAMGVSMGGEASISNTLNNNSGIISGKATGTSSSAAGVTMVGFTNILNNNAGTITGNTTGTSSEADGVAMGGITANNLTNSGNISGKATGTSSHAYGVSMIGATNTLKNYGSITGSATGTSPDAYGVNMDGSDTVTNNVTNSGSISGATGILVNAGDTTIDNSGTITGSGGTAIQLADAVNSVILRTGSVINGVIKGGGTCTDSMELNDAGVLNAGQIVNFENLTKTGTGMWSITAGAAPLNIDTAISINTGTLTFGGNVTTTTYTQNTGAILGLIVNPTTSATVTAAEGTATLNNGGVLVVPEAGFYDRFTTYSPVFTAGTISGVFGEVSSTSPFLTPYLGAAGPNSYSLTLVRDYSLPASTENQRVMAAVLNAYADTMVGGASGSGLAHLMLISSSAEAQNALDQISGLSHTALMGASFSSFNQYLGSITGRMGGFATGGPSFAYTGRTLFASRDDIASDAGNTLLALGEMRGNNDPTAWGFWARGYGNLGEMRGDDISSKYDYNTGGVTTGFDKKISNNFLLGLSAGYSYTKVDMKNLSDTGNVSSYQGSLYGAYLNGPWYVNGILAYSHNIYHTSRNISFGGMSSVASADYSGDTLAAYGEAGYRIEINTVNIIPMASFQASYLTRNGFTEIDGGDLSLTADGEHRASYLSALGIKMRKDFSVKKTTITPEVRVKWLHEFSDDDNMLHASFAEAPSSTFIVKGDKPDRDSIALGFGLTCLAKENLNIFLTYDANIASDRTEQGVSLGLRYRW